MLKAYKFRPGYFRDSTNYSAEGGWNDGDKVRFRAEFPEKIGGWKKVVPGQTIGVCRSLIRWDSNSKDRYIGLGTEKKFYILWGGTYYDVTPIRLEATLTTDPLATVDAGSGLIEVTHTGNGVAQGDYFQITGATGLDGISDDLLNGEHVVKEVVSSSVFRFRVDGAATSGSVAGGGSSVHVSYQINIGAADYSAGTGWGAGPWGANGYGEPSDVTIPGNQIRVWSQDNFGEDLIAAPLNGAIYYWDKTNGVNTRMVPLSSMAGHSDTPTICLLVGVSSLDRHVIAFGVNGLGDSVLDPLLVRWSSQEDAVNWTPAPDNTAGGYRLSLGSSIIATAQTKQERLIWTDTALYSMRFTGAPYTFSFEVVSGHISILSPNAHVQFNDQDFWMGYGNFYTYGGTVATLPCTVRDYVFSNINMDQRYKIFAGRVTKFGEVWWFYPSANSEEVDRYVAYSTIENAWHYGAMERTAWLENTGDTFPYAAGGGYLYAHENGDDADGDPLPAYIQSADFDIDAGEKFAFVRRIIPDLEYRGDAPITDQAVSVVVLMRRSPGVDAIVASVMTQAGKDSYKNIRARGRQASIRVESTLPGTGWRMGIFRMDIREDGRR